MKSLILILSLFVGSSYAGESSINAFSNKMSEHHQFDKAEINQLISSVEPNETILRLFSKPFTSIPWDEFEAKLVHERRIRDGIAFWKENAETLKKAEEVYGVPPEVIVGLLGVETNYGNNIGGYRVLDALITLGFYAHRRQEYFQYELEHFLLIARELGWNYDELKGSYAGAIGITQFMPSNIKKFAVDFDGDGKIDLVTNKIDAIGSVANYLSKAGWKRNDPVAVQVSMNGPKGKTMVLRTLPGPAPTRWKHQHNFGVIKRYNPSDSYAMTIFILSKRIQSGYSATLTND